MYNISLKVSDCIRPDAMSDILNKVIECCRGTSVEFIPVPYSVDKLKDMCKEVTIGIFEYEDDEEFCSLFESLDFELFETFGCSLIPLDADSIFEMDENDVLYLTDDTGDVEWVED